MTTLELVHFDSNSDIEYMISACEKENHTQQVAYSAYFGRLTQVCFDCRAVRTIG